MAHLMLKLIFRKILSPAKLKVKEFRFGFWIYGFNGKGNILLFRFGFSGAILFGLKKCCTNLVRSKNVKCRLCAFLWAFSNWNRFSFVKVQIGMENEKNFDLMKWIAKTLEKHRCFSWKKMHQRVQKCRARLIFVKNLGRSRPKKSDCNRRGCLCAKPRKYCQ